MSIFKALFRPAACAALAICYSSATVYAIDIITRKSESNRIAGEVTAVTKTSVTIKPQTGAEVEIPANDIKLIEWDAAPARVNGAKGQEQNGQLEAAIKEYQSVLDEVPVTATNLRTDLQFLIARALGKLAMADKTRLPEAIARLKKFTDENASSFRYYEALDYLGRLYLESGDYAQAEAAFTKIEASPFTDLQLSAKSSKAHVLLAQGQVDQALSGFDAVLNAPANDEATKQRQLEARLGKAKCLSLKDQYDQSLTLLGEVVAQADAADARLQAEAQVLRGEALLGQGNNQEALLAYLLVDILFTAQQDYHAEALYNLTKLWPIVGQPGRAEEARAKLESSYPNSPWTKKLTGA